MKTCAAQIFALVLLFPLCPLSAHAQSDGANVATSTRAAPREVEAGRIAAQAVLGARRSVRDNDDFKGLREAVAALQTDLGAETATEVGQHAGSPERPTLKEWPEAKLTSRLRTLQTRIARAELRARSAGGVREYMAPALEFARSLETELKGAMRQQGNNRLERLIALRHRLRAHSQRGDSAHASGVAPARSQELPPTFRFSSDLPVEP